MPVSIEETAGPVAMPAAIQPAKRRVVRHRTVGPWLAAGPGSPQVAVGLCAGYIVRYTGGIPRRLRRPDGLPGRAAQWVVAPEFMFRQMNRVITSKASRKTRRRANPV